jgi:hypothetical protein
VPQLPLIEDLTTGPIPQGLNLLVEFDAESNWHNASITIAAGWLRSGNFAAYNVAVQPPGKIRSILKLLGLNPEIQNVTKSWKSRTGYTTSVGQSSTEKSVPLRVDA